jgi:hypothetical protein
MTKDPRSDASFTPRFPAVWAVATYALCAFSLAWPALLGRTLVADASSDQFRAGYAFREFAATYFKTHGSVPLWNPYLQGGMPFVGAMHGDIFYPTALMRLVMPTEYGITWGLIAHFFLCGLATYAFLRVAGRRSFTGALVGGIAYMMAGFVSSLVSPGHDGKLFVNALFPVLLLLIWWSVGEGKRWAYGLFAGAVGLTLLTPHPQLFEQAMVFAGAWAVFLAFSGIANGPIPRPVALQRLGAALLMVGVGVAIGAIQYMPAAEYKPWSPRAPGLGWDGATSFSFPIEELLNLYLPQFSGILENYWGRNGIHFHSEYAGVIVLMLVGLALGGPQTDGERRFKRFWIWTGAASLIWALGRYTPLYNIIYYIVPLVKYMRAPSTVFFVTAFAMSVLASIGAERAVAGAARRGYLMGWLIAAGAVTLLAMSGALSAVAQALVAIPQFSDRIDAGAGALKLGALRSLVFVGLGAGLLHAIGRGTIRAGQACAVLALIAAADLWSIDRLYWSAWGGSAKEVFATDATIDYLKKQPGPFRVLSVEDPSKPAGTSDPYLGNIDGLMAHGIRQTLGYHGNQIGRYDVYQPVQMWFNPSTWALTNTRYLLINNDSFDIPGARRVVGPVKNAAGSPVSLYELPGANPFAWVAPAVMKYPDESIVEALRAPNFPAQSVALIDPSSKTAAVTLTTVPAPLPITVATTTYEAGRIAMTLSAPAPSGAALVVSENYYPGWVATVDGKPVTPERANLTLIGVPLPAGAKSVELTFTSAAYSTGRTITWLAVAIAVLATIVGAATARREPSTAGAGGG